MNNQSRANEKAWNYRAYGWWSRYNGPPEEYAAELRRNPEANINWRYGDLLTDLDGKRILNALGSNGRKAVPLALLGAEVTIIDISDENRQYAMELAEPSSSTTSTRFERFCRPRSEPTETTSRLSSMRAASPIRTGSPKQSSRASPSACCGTTSLARS